MKKLISVVLLLMLGLVGVASGANTDRIADLIDNGAGKSGRVPQGLENAPGIQKQLPADVSYDFDLIRILDDEPCGITPGVECLTLQNPGTFTNFWDVSQFQPDGHIELMDSKGDFFDVILSTGEVIGKMFDEPDEWADVPADLKIGKTTVYVESRGNFYVADQAQNTVFEVTPDGIVVNSFFTNANTSVAYHAARNTLFFVSLYHTVYEFTLEGDFIQIFDVQDYGPLSEFKFRGIAYDARSQNLLLGGTTQAVPDSDRYYAGLVFNPYDGTTVGGFTVSHSPGTISGMNMNIDDRHMYTTSYGHSMYEYAPVE